MDSESEQSSKSLPIDTQQTKGKSPDTAQQIQSTFAELAPGLKEATAQKVEEYRERIRQAYQDGNFRELPNLKRDFLALGGEADFDPTAPVTKTLDVIPEPTEDGALGERRLALLQGRTSVGGEYVQGNYNGKNYILDSKGNLIMQVSESEVVTIDGKQIQVARVRDRADFSGATLPDTKILLVGDKVFGTLLNPQAEIKAGYKARESIGMVVGHELTHVKFQTLPPEERQQIIDYYSGRWGQIHDFATTLLLREDYRKVVLSATLKTLTKNPDAKIRPVVIKGKTFSVAVESVVSELLAYNSTNILLGEPRVKELDKINPTKEQIHREHLSVKAGEVFSRLRRPNQIIPGQVLYNNLPNELTQIMSAVSKIARR